MAENQGKSETAKRDPSSRAELATGQGRKSETALREERVLEFWRENKTFERSLEKDSPKGEFVFYDGPPFANGLPHYGHILASTIKDVIPRYRTMQGFRVHRQWGWDCHGLPVENLVEKELGLKTKRDIEQYGIEKFNEAARVSIMKDVDAWKKIIPRLGRWADMENDYKTMDSSYTESVWWAFKELWKKGLVEKSFKAMHLCPHCGTTLSNFEVSQGYKDIQDISVTVKLPLEDEPNTYLLVWTTTPWTLPGNMAAAVNPGLTYVLAEKDGVKYVVAKERASVLGENARVEKEFLGSELVGKKYSPPFPYYQDSKIEHKENAWKVYAAPYVEAKEGTGLVHLAPAFGEEDLLLARKEGIPIVHHVDMNGKFVAEVADFAGKQAKPKEDHQSSDIEIIKYLAHRNLLFAKEKITHSYPHCWRCDTPLLNYAATSWFVNVPKIKNKLVAENNKVGWVPESVGKYRFGNWLEGAREWAISRSRFWGAPLPIWESKDGERMFIGSLEELKQHIKKSGNTYFVMRHGEAENNTKDIVNCDNTNPCHLTEEGRSQVVQAVGEMAKPDIIFVSPLVRGEETAAIIAKHFGMKENEIIADRRIGEVDFGAMNDRPRREYHAQFEHVRDQFSKKSHSGESWRDVRRRVGEFLTDIESKYAGKNILIISHNTPLVLMRAIAKGETEEQIAKRTHTKYGLRGHEMENGKACEMPFVPLPWNAHFELDYHRPYIDEVVLEKDGREYRRVPEVFDCWFESGSMPFASNHYPFTKENFDPKRWLGFAPKGYPADFIAEGLDQTRGWFYSLIVLGTAIFGRSPYQQVIVNGLVLAEDGQKMSKRLKNYPDPMEVVDTCGADALRFYLLSSPVVRGEDLNFSLKSVQEIANKNIGRLANVLAFYKLYDDGTARSNESSHVLDQWILARLAELVRDTTKGYEAYELDAATRPLASFIDDLSAWYVRRSRERMKSEWHDKQRALATLRYVLYQLSHVMAPITPFFAEHLFREVRVGVDPESVHLALWPTASTPDQELLDNMQFARNIVTKTLEARDKAGIKVRQPLRKLAVGSKRLAEKSELLNVIRDEVNVKEVVIDTNLPEGEVRLDTELTPELQEEGIVRDLIRAIQGARKEAGFTVGDKAKIIVTGAATTHDIVRRNEEDIIGATGAVSIEMREGSESVSVAKA